MTTEKPEDEPGAEYVFSLYITGATANSVRAVKNMREICETHLNGRYKLQIIDVYQHPTLARRENLIALPLLVKKFPLPERRLIGDLADKEKVLKVICM